MARRKKRVRIKKVEEKINIRFIVMSLIVIAILLVFSDFLSIDDKGILDIKNEGGYSSEDKVMMYLPAVDVEGEGVNTVLIVEVIPGDGRTLTDIDNLLFWADTQHSIRVAKKVAENITGKKLQNYDIVYTIEANASIIGGPSAGAALALATIAALEDKKLRDDVMITGTINHDGTIGPVSAILEKAKVSKEKGATLFLVPALQSRELVYEQAEHCEIYGQTTICTTETKPRKLDVSEEAGIEIREVVNVQEAIGYFFD